MMRMADQSMAVRSEQGLQDPDVRRKLQVSNCGYAEQIADAELIPGMSECDASRQLLGMQALALRLTL